MDKNLISSLPLLGRALEAWRQARGMRPCTYPPSSLNDGVCEHRSWKINTHLHVPETLPGSLMTFTAPVAREFPCGKCTLVKKQSYEYTHRLVNISQQKQVCKLVDTSWGRG